MTILPLELVDIHLAFGGHAVLRGLSAEVGRSEIVALFGPNGAGKSTTFSIAIGLLDPDRGSRRFAGEDRVAVDVELRSELAYVSHAPQLYAGLTAAENLSLVVDLYRSAGWRIRRTVAEVLDWVGLRPDDRRPVSSFSRGMAQRVAIARALLPRPELFVFDEPFTSLDRAGKRLLCELMRAERDRGAGLFVCSHDEETLRSLADRCLVLREGRAEIDGRGR